MDLEVSVKLVNYCLENRLTPDEDKMHVLRETITININNNMTKLMKIEQFDNFYS